MINIWKICVFTHNIQKLALLILLRNIQKLALLILLRNIQKLALLIIYGKYVYLHITFISRGEIRVPMACRVYNLSVG